MTTNDGYIFRSGRVCCVVGCNNSEYRNTNLHYYTFPGRKYEVDRKRRWTEAVRQTMIDQTWMPGPNTRICSKHFVGGKKSTLAKDEAYVPTIFPGIYVANKSMDDSESEHTKAESWMPDSRDPLSDEPDTRELIKDEDEFIIEDELLGKSSEAHKADKEKNPDFLGIDGVANEKVLLQLGGVSPDTFSMLLKIVESDATRSRECFQYMKIENELLLFLMKVKFGLPFTALGPTFHVRPRTASTAFFYLVKILAERTRPFIFWPADEKESYPLSLACIEIPVDTPRNLDQRILLYSNGNGDFFAKFLIAITAQGVVCQVSKVYGGRVTNSIIAKHCGFVNFTEDKIFDSTKSPEKLQVQKALKHIKNSRILRRVSIELLPHLDSIMHICCVLANSQLTQNSGDEI